MYANIKSMDTRYKKITKEKCKEALTPDEMEEQVQ